MKQVKYICSHCGNRFEAEERDVLECPKCYWSSSVKKEDDVEAEKSFSTKPDSSAKIKKRSSGLLSFVVRLVGFLFIVAIISILVSFGLKALVSQSQKNPKKASKQDAVTIQTSQAALDAIPELKESLSEEDKNILARRVRASVNRDPSQEEKKILDNQANLVTGLVEKLPSQPWTLESFKEMIVEQERFYKVPLPKSYKKKLYKLIEEKYVPSIEAFRAGDLLSARNMWVESLIFPIYGDDILKHRGVAMTMMRPFINDTLSKIAAVNNILMERKIRDKEAQLNQQYSTLLGLIKQKKYAEAFDVLLDLEKRVDELEKPQVITDRPPRYPRSVQQVDRDLQIPLIELLSAPTPPVTDLGPLKGDLFEKRKVLQSFSEESLQKQQELYDAAMDYLDREEWSEASTALKQIRYPQSLLKDAQDKIQVLKKHQHKSQEQFSS